MSEEQPTGIWCLRARKRVSLAPMCLSGGLGRAVRNKTMPPAGCWYDNVFGSGENDAFGFHSHAGHFRLGVIKREYRIVRGDHAKPPCTQPDCRLADAICQPRSNMTNVVMGISVRSRSARAWAKISVAFLKMTCLYCEKISIGRSVVFRSEVDSAR